MAKAKSRSSKKPTRATLWVYSVGFGDCLLLELGYATETRFVLFDFGTKGAAETNGATAAKGSPMVRIAEDIAGRVNAAQNGRLVAVVATHRHSDHVSGFAPAKNGKGSGDIIAALRPAVVVQPWTDDPSAQDNWRGPVPKGKANGRDATDALGLTPGTLKLVEQFAAYALEQSEVANGRFGRTALEATSAVAKNNVANRAALDQLARMCPKSKHDYVHAGMRPTNFAMVLPGVDIKVLGPPTLHQCDEIFRKYAKSAPSEYWIARVGLSDERSFWQRATAMQDFAAGAARRGKRALFPRSRRVACPPEVRWLVERMKRDRGDSLFEFVRSADQVLNNTSVVLLLTIGGKRLLFAGDAQLESWQH